MGVELYLKKRDSIELDRKEDDKLENNLATAYTILSSTRAMQQ